MSDTSLEAAALARNDRYLLEFVEALQLCPWARKCREWGRLARRVILHSHDAASEGAAPEARSPEPEARFNDAAPEARSPKPEAPLADPHGLARWVEAAMPHVRDLAAMTAEQCEVGLLIFPALPAWLRDGLDGARAFEQLCTALRERMARDFAASPAGAPFYCVAFHPELNMDLQDENRAVRFIRRSPDPTIQLVRVSVLAAARGSQGDTLYVDASKLSHDELMKFERPLSISEKIAKQNFDTLQREGPERLRALLAGMAHR